VESLKRAGKSENLVLKKKKLSLFFKLYLNNNTTFQVTEKDLTSSVRNLQKKIINKVLTVFVLQSNDTS